MINLINRITYYARSYSWFVDPRWLLPVPNDLIDRPIFLLGMQGGGLTLLSRMLRRHPKLISVTGNSSYWSGADELANVYGLVIPAEFAGMRFKCPPHPILTGPRSWSYACNELLGFYRKRACDATTELKRNLIRIIQVSAKRFATEKNDYRFLDKSQTTTVRVGFFFKLLEEFDPKFVLLLRDPYISVFRAAMGKAGDMRRYMEKKILSDKERVRICSEHLGNSMRAVFEDVDELGIHMHILRFEDLLRNPELFLRKVCDFVEITFEDGMLPHENHKLPFGSRFHDRWYPLRTEVNDRYESELPEYLLDCVNELCADVIPKMGYRVRLNGVT